MTRALVLALAVAVGASLGCAIEPYDLGGRSDVPGGLDGGTGDRDGGTVDGGRTGDGGRTAEDGGSRDGGTSGEGGLCMPETCNGADDDCDGVIDDGFDFLADPNHCGGCTACVLDHAIARCAAGACAILSCDVGFSDVDGEPGTGCELPCAPVGPEVCDGIDDDCDGLTDSADPDLMTPIGACTQIGACAGATAVCAASSGWTCEFPTGAETTGAGRLVVEETLCDGIDGDCDGLPDDPFLLVGTACNGAGVGACADQGVFECTADGSDVECVITRPAQPAADERCNGIDDDCDGAVDEQTDGPVFRGVHDDMVPIAVGTRTFWIYANEASRPDATATFSGADGSRACSRADVVPWSSVTHADAVRACAAAGAHLCSEADWRAACSGATSRAYPYGATYDPAICNGLDHDGDPSAAGDQDVALRTGELAACTTPEGALDLSGNLKEWTADLRGMTGTPPRSVFGVLGGSYDSPRDGLRCDFTFGSAPDDYAYANLGFRCCRDTPP